MRITSVNQLYDKVIKKVQWARFGRTHMENYRGHALCEYKLLSGLGRFEFQINDFKRIEKCLNENFLNAVEKNEIDAVRRPFSEKVENAELKNYWYSIFQAQHLGLKTRLMDWSISWETSLMFAVENESHHGKDGSFWIYYCQKENLYNTDNLYDVISINPLDFKGDSMINSPIYLFDNIFDIIGEKRMGRQSGRFWTQSIEKCNIPLNEQPEFSDYLQEIIIDGDSKASIKKELANMGNTLDWKYYRKDETINAKIKEINKNCIK